ncbi:Zinc finger BED domain-containing protein 4 [Frankliniella fusca]|uniref:Zinc finger BED domain-containing protein 4 n=1 Tax=Frankliniella fusca TaxID=407009 RepID=A0AAE1HKA2_9NEOP|nr:Zinc finger BED domain-containing protein 4 [Frankliniella fusca]
MEEDEDDFEDAIENCMLRGAIFKVKKIVRFFRQSEVATTELTKLQMEESEISEGKTLKLIQEVKTRWNSCFAMLERFLQLHENVARVILKLQRDKNSKSKPPAILTMDEIDALTEVRDLLRPLDIATKESITRQTPVTPVGFNLKADLTTRLSNAFGKIEDIKLYQCATILDPRFKKAAFASAQSAANAEAYVGE